MKSLRSTGNEQAARLTAVGLLFLAFSALALIMTVDHVLNDIWLVRLRALLARAEGEDEAYRDYRDRYRAMADRLGFEGHMAMAEAMA